MVACGPPATARRPAGRLRPIPRRRQRRAARNPRPTEDADPQETQEGLDWLRERVLEHASDEPEALCDKLVDDPFVPHPAPDDLCVLILRTEAP